MCVETMDTKSKRIQTDCLLHKTVKPGSKLRWRLVRVSAERDEEDERYRAAAAAALAFIDAVRGTTRKHLHREKKRAQLAKLAGAPRDAGRGERTRTREPAYAESPAAARMSRRPPGAMAPENTTQYLMSNAYEDMETSDIQPVPVPRETTTHLYGENLSPSGVYAALDSGYGACLAFQQRDFEDMFDRPW